MLQVLCGDSKGFRVLTFALCKVCLTTSLWRLSATCEDGPTPPPEQLGGLATGLAVAVDCALGL